MLRYVLIKLPGFTCISDVPVSSPYHVRMLRALPPVKHQCREYRKNSDFTRNVCKRSFSYPSDPRQKREYTTSRHRRLYSGSTVQETKCEHVTPRKDLPLKIKKSSKKHHETVENEKHRKHGRRGLDHSKEFQLAENEIDERFYDIYQASEQYELEAAKPRRSQSELTFNVFELIEKRNPKSNAVEHLQPYNLKPFGSMETPQSPTVMSRSSTVLRLLPGYDENEPYTSDKKYRRAEDVQQREYSTSSRLSPFRLEDHVQMIQNLPPIPVTTKYSVGSTSNLLKKSGETNNVKLEKLRNTPSEDQSEMNHQKLFRLPWRQHDIVPLSKDKSERSIKTLKPLETPWPSYSDILKRYVHNSATQNEGVSLRSTTESSFLPVESDPISIDMHSSNMKKLQQIGKQIDDKLVRTSNFLQKASTLPQKRRLSTEPVLTRNSLKQSETASQKIKPVKLLSLEKLDIQTKSYSKKSRPMEPKSCDKEKPPDKCFLPSRIRLKPPPCTPKIKSCHREEPCVRADDCLKIEPKRLPQLAVSPCPCIEPDVPEINPRLKRLNMHFQDPPRECPCNPCPCAPRADDNLVEKPKKLKPLKHGGTCICVDHPLVDVSLKRLQKVCTTEEKCHKKVECPKEEPCVRADDTLKVCEKPLPKLKVGPCPCVEQPIPAKNPKLRRLKFAFKDPPKICPSTPPCPPRADDNIIEGVKKLPVHVPGECACIEPPPMVDIPLRRLQKVCIPEEKCYPKVDCPPPEPCVRADDCMREELKPLPILRTSECLCEEKFVPDKAPRMKRLEMDFKDEPKVCPCEPNCPCPPRADDAQPHKTKKLPQLVPGECPCVEVTPMVEVPLKRLQKVCMPEEKSYSKIECPLPEPCQRADDTLCVKPKELPLLEAKVCPCIEDPPLKESPALKRLNLRVAEPPKVCPETSACVDQPRADDRLEERRKPLPILKAGHCPCIEPPLVADVNPLKRLKCEEEQEDCPTVDPCLDYPRADLGCWEYWTAEKNKCNTGEKAKKKNGVTVNTKRKFNTASRLRLYDEIKKLGQTRVQIEKYSTRSNDPIYKNDNSAAEVEEFNSKEKNGWMVRKPEIMNKSPEIQLHIKPLVESTPTIFLLKQLDDVQKNKHRNLVERILDAKPGHSHQKSAMSSPNVRNLSTDVQAVGAVRSISSDGRGSKKKKNSVKRKSVCHKLGETCELNSKLPCVNTKCHKSCDKIPKYACCDKKPPPYPAFSEMMEEEVEPYSESRQWTCNKSEFGFHPRHKRLNNPFGADKDKKNYTTTTLTDNILAVEVAEEQKDYIITKNSFRRSSTNSKKEESKKCVKKKKCPKFKLENCPQPEIRAKCHKVTTVICDKPEAPYPAFTDCLDEELAENLSECPLDVERVRQLQPRYIQPLDKPKLMKPVAPILGKIDLMKEEECVREKLSMKKTGLSQTCDEFGKYVKPMRAKNYLKVRDRNCEKIDELKKLGRLPPKNSRGFCTSTSSILVKKTPLSEETQEIYDKPEKSKIQTILLRNLTVRNYHILCMKPHGKIIEDSSKTHEKQYQAFTEDDCCRYKKLRNVQWRINNFQKWHRLNKLNSLPGYVNKFHSNMDIRNRCTNVEHGQKTFSTSAANMISPCETRDVPMHRRISTTFILARAKNNEIGYVHVRKEKKSTKVTKSCPKLSFGGDSARKRFDCSRKKSNKKPFRKQLPRYSECPIATEGIKHLQPQYPILPELETPLLDTTIQGELNVTLDTECALQKHRVENMGVTQNCRNFGEKINPLRVRMAMDSIKVDNRIAEVPNVHFSSSVDVENKPKVNVHRSDQVEDNKGSTTPSQCFEAKLSQKLEFFMPSSYKTCPEPPQDSKITQQSCAEYQERHAVHECSTRAEQIPSHDMCSTGKSLWEKIANYFKARPNCPAPDEWKKKAAKAKAEKYAKVAGLVVVDPKELPPKKGKCPPDDLPTVITHHSCCSHKKNIASSGRKSFSTTTVIKHHKSENNRTCWCRNNIKANVSGSYQRPFQTISDGNMPSSVYNWDNPQHNFISGGENSECENKAFDQGHFEEKIGSHDKQKSEWSLKQTTPVETVMKSFTKHGGSFNTSGSSLDSNKWNDVDMGEFVQGINEENPYSSPSIGNAEDPEVTHQNVSIASDEALCWNTGHNGAFLSSLGSVSTHDEADDTTSVDKNKNLTREQQINANDSKQLATSANDAEPKIRKTGFSAISSDSLGDKNNDFESSEYFSEKPKHPNSNYQHHFNDIDKEIFGTSLTSTVNTCATQDLANMNKGIQIMNRKHPFLSVMRRYYSKNSRCRNLEEINESLEEDERKKKLAKKVGKSFLEGSNVSVEHGYDDISITSQKNSEAIEDVDTVRSNVRSKDDVPNRSCDICCRKPGFFDVIFQEPIHGISGYNQAKTFAAFQEYFHKIEVLSDISYEEIERVKTSNLVKELDKLIVDNKKQNIKS